MLQGSVPGASGWSNFHRNVEPLVSAGYWVILVDAPGCSKSDSIVSRGPRADLNTTALKGLLDVPKALPDALVHRENRRRSLRWPPLSFFSPTIPQIFCIARKSCR